MVLIHYKTFDLMKKQLHTCVQKMESMYVDLGYLGSILDIPVFLSTRQQLAIRCPPRCKRLLLKLAYAFLSPGVAYCCKYHVSRLVE